MKRNILQIPIKAELREKAENKATQLGFSSLQEMIRVILTQLTGEDSRAILGIADLCNKYQIKYLGLFGSMARGDAKSGSDIDLLVKFDGKNTVGLFKLAQIQEEFEKRLGRKVDLVTKMNKHIKPVAMKDLQTIYEK